MNEQTTSQWTLTNQNSRQAATRETLDRVMHRADLPPALREVVWEALAAPGKLLASPSGSRWPDLVLFCCAAASGGDWQLALPAAVAAEFFALALDLLDEIEDDDPSPLRERYGVPVTLNCSTALLGLAQFALDSSAERRGADTYRMQCYSILAQTTVTAAGGQHLDLIAEKGTALTQDQILDVIARKSGALVGGCCALGAAVAGVDTTTLELYRRFGRHVGIAGQLDNDMHDLWHGVAAGARTGEGKSDLRRSKQTVPLAFLRDTLAATTSEMGPTLEKDLWDTGALPYTWAMVQVHRAEALRLLEDIDAVSPVPGMPLSLLKHLTASMLEPSTPHDQLGSEKVP